MVIVALLAACAPGEEAEKGDTEDSAMSVVDSAPPDDTDAVTGTRVTGEGDVTWAVDFGEESEAGGYTDCAYVRHYVGAEDRSAPWLCPQCDVVLVMDVEMTDGREDCYAEVSSTDPVDTEYLGFGADVWYRGAGSWLTERGPAITDGDTVTISQEVGPDESGGDFSFVISGTITLGTDDGDPYAGYEPPDTYACGWPKADLPAYSGDFVGTVGATMPDGAFTDLCEEPVRLYDLAGEYLVVDISAMDCGPCQSAAALEEAFVEDMAAAGAPTRVVTLLAPSLSDVGGTPTHAELQTWVDTFSLTSPVLADRMWGLSVAGQPLGEEFGYPTFLIVSPSLEILSVQVGFGDFSDIESVILRDAGL